MSTPEAWRGILDEGEVILWQGQPEPGVQNEWPNAFHPIFFTFFTGFSLVWMVLAALAGGFFWMFGLLFFGVGLYALVGVHYYKAYLRQHTYYTLTNRRAFIARDVFGKRTLDSYPIGAETRLTYREHKGLETIHFASRKQRTKNGTYDTPIGFERLNDGREVYAQMRKVKQSA